MTDGRKIEAIHSSAVRRSRNSRRFFTFALIVLLVFFLVFMYLNFFKIRSIEIKGLNTDVYSEAEMLDFIGVGEGDNLLSLRASRLEKEIEREFAYVNHAKLRRRLPSTLVIELEFHSASMGVVLGDDVFFVSSGGKVLTSGDAEDGMPEGVCKIKTPFITECIQGENLLFESEETFNILVDVYSQFESFGLSKKLTYLDITDKFNIKAKVDDRFEIVFGSWEDSEAKVKLLSEVMSGDIWTDSSGIVDISDSREAAVRFTGSVAN